MFSCECCRCLAEKASSEATVAADAIQQDVEQTRLKEFDLHAFASQGVGGLERYVSIIARKVPKKTDVLVATTTQTKSDEGTAADDSETKPLKENKPNQRGVKRQEVEMKVVRKHGLCRKQLMNIIREKMTPKEAMEACQKGRNDGQCKFCKSCGEIKPEFVQMAKDILGSKDDEEATAEQK